MHLKVVTYLPTFLRYQVEENNFVDCRDLFGANVNLLPLELLMYTKPLDFPVGSTNISGVSFYQMYFLPQLNIPYFLNLLLCNSSDVVVGFCITST